MKILLVGDEARMRRLMAFGLATASDQPSLVGSLSELGRLPGLRDYDVALLDWEMRAEESSEVLARLRQLAPAVPVVAMTSREARVADAIAAGAVDTLMKPIDIDSARDALARVALPPVDVTAPAVAPSISVAVEKPVRGVERASSLATASSAPMTAKAATAIPPPASELVTKSPLLRRQLLVATKAARTMVNVLLLGENGTGKTHLARSIHNQSPRRDQPFVTVNCPCLHPQLLESELFGHVRGAFTGAVSDTAGLVAAAEGGTLFLDEIGELPPALQPKLLRLLQERCYERVGEARTRTADIRIVAATNRDLAAEVAAGRFREDLFYRLNVISLELPALRQRPEDVLPMALQLLEEFAKSAGRKLAGFSAEARMALQRHSWPGNLRELRNCIERAVILCERDVIDVDDLPNLTTAPLEATPQVGDFVTLATLEEAHIRRVVEKAGSFMQAARLLGINKTTLYRRRRRQDEGANTLPFDEDLRAAMTG
jgi:two-component system, NtrC family, response regulator AlgB